MIDQDKYNIAEWLVYNADAVKSMLKPSVDRWLDAKYKLADRPIFALQYETDIKARIKDRIMYIVGEHFPKHTAYDMEEAFQDERILIILDKYYKLEDM